MDTPSNYLVADKFLAAEHNPFEQSFAIRPSSSSAPGGNGTETPKPALPSVMEMFTPGGTNQYEHFNFAESLRHGPLSPNLLSGPQGPLPFDPANFRTGLTPNESNIRTGLTPGNTPGFPLLPTPGTVALLGAYTPNTAAAISSMQSTTFPTVAPFPAQPAARPADVFGESQAANGLVFLAQTSQQQQQQAQATQNIGPAAGTRDDVRRVAPNNSKANLSKEKEEQAPTGKTQRTRKGKEENAPNGKDNAKKMKTTKNPETDDDKRKNFLERNRQGIHSPFRFPVALTLFFLHSLELGLMWASCSEMPSTQKAMAQQSPAKSRLLHPRKRSPTIRIRTTQRTMHGIANPVVGAQGLSCRSTKRSYLRRDRAGRWSN
jgi:ATF/CREB family transcription factor